MVEVITGKATLFPGPSVPLRTELLVTCLDALSVILTLRFGVDFVNPFFGGSSLRRATSLQSASARD